MRINYAIEIAKLPDERLEALVNDWLNIRKKAYHSSKRWSGPGDMGRDVVGYCSEQRHEGEWDNYQCKQLGTRLSEKSAFVELGKIFMHSAAGQYRLPRAYYFVAPQGVVRNVQAFEAHPERFRQAFLDRWNSEIAGALVENDSVPLSPEIEKAIRSFDFTRLYTMDAAALADDPAMLPVLVGWFGADPGPAPAGTVPAMPSEEEAIYLGQLAHIYGERAGTSFANSDDVLRHSEWGPHLVNQRTRYFDAAAFRRFYRDSMPPNFLVDFNDDIYHGVVDVYLDEHRDGVEKMTRVLGQAASVQPKGVLGKHAGSSVKQGTCHHFANEGRMPWKR